MTMPELALRFVLASPDVSTVIPGMRKTRNVAANLAAARGGPAAGRPRRAPQGPPLGPDADRVVAVARYAGGASTTSTETMASGRR